MIETPRLKLVPLTHEQILLLQNDPSALAIDLNINHQELIHDPSVLNDVEEAIEFWSVKTREHASKFEWYTNWQIILKDEAVIIGGIGFAGEPDEQGKSMLGYGLDIRYHGKGFATEATKALVQWAFLDLALKAITATTPVAHFTSEKVLIKNGFQETRRDERLVYWELAR